METKNQHRIRIRMWRLNNPQYAADFKREYPWISHYHEAKRRCTNKRDKSFSRYGGRGIKCCITVEQVKSLWLRDSAHLLKNPSIDRKNNNGNYTIKNCRFIEKSENRKSGRVIIRIDLNGKRTKYKTLVLAALAIGRSHSGHIGACASGKQVTAYGYRWEYAK